MGMLMRRHFNSEQTALVNDVQEEVTETLEDKTVADLRIIAQQRGFTGISALTKAELLDLLK
nr:MAG TPA: dimeris T4 recombination endonuclease VII [Caudoviricetes sp.]